VQEVDLKEVGLAEYEDVYPVRTDIQSFLRDNANEIGLRTSPINGIIKKTSSGITLFNAAIAGLLL